MGTLAVDIAFSQTGDAFWAIAGRWLLGAGLVMAALAALAGLTDFLGEPRIRALSAAWHHLVGNVTAVVIELINLWQRLERGADFIAPTGLILSALVTLLLLYNGWRGWEVVYRARVGVVENGRAQPAR